MDDSIHDTKLEQKIIAWRQIQEESRKLVQLTDGLLNMDNIKHIGAMDIGYISSDPDSTIWQGYCTLTLSHFPSMLPYFQQSKLVTIEEPYVSGFLAFREASVYIKIYRDFLRLFREEFDDIPPANVLLIDGAGTYHVRECGSACMVGLGLNIPTIGISKSPVLFEGVADIQARCDSFWDANPHATPMPIMDSNKPEIFYGYALRGTSRRPHYVSPGHMISHELAVTIVQRTRANPDLDPIKLSDKGGRVLVGQVR